MHIERQVNIAPFTTFKIGGKADYFCRAQSVEDVRTALAFGRTHRLPWRVLGGGSNVLVADEGLQGLTIKIECKGREYTPAENGIVRARIGAGENWDDFVADTVTRELWGIENLSAIPGTVGAAPIQNIGAYGTEVKDVVEKVEALDAETGITRELSRSECKFGYRDSLFKSPEGKRFIVTSVTFRLTSTGVAKLDYRDVAAYFADRTTPPALSDIRAAIVAIRARKFPDLREIGTAGSFFKNPIIEKSVYGRLTERFSDMPAFPVDAVDSRVSEQVKIPAAWLIEHVGGFRGVRHGAVGSFQNQALVIVNCGDAKAAEVETFAQEIRAKIFAETDIELEFEVQILGDR